MITIVKIVCKGLKFDKYYSATKSFSPRSPRISSHSLFLLSHLLSSIKTKCRDSVLFPFPKQNNRHPLRICSLSICHIQHIPAGRPCMQTPFFMGRVWFVSPAGAQIHPLIFANKWSMRFPILLRKSTAPSEVPRVNPDCHLLLSGLCSGH